MSNEIPQSPDGKLEKLSPEQLRSIFEHLYQIYLIYHELWQKSGGKSILTEPNVMRMHGTLNEAQKIAFEYGQEGLDIYKDIWEKE